MGRRLAEPDPGVQQHPLLRDAFAHREGEALLQEGLDVVHDVRVARLALHRARLAEHVHQAALGAALGEQTDHLRIAAQGGDVVDDAGAGAQGRPRHGGLGGVDRDPRAARQFAGESLHDGQHAAQLLGLGDRLGSRSRGFTADVEDLGALFGELQAVGECGPGVEEQPPVGERVGGHVEDPHQAERRARGAPLGRRLGRLGGPPGWVRAARQRSTRRCQASSGRSGRSPRMSAVPPARPGRGSGRGASRPGRSSGAGGAAGSSGAVCPSAGPKTSSSLLP